MASSINIERIEQGRIREESPRRHLNTMKKYFKTLVSKWWLLILNCVFFSIGTIGGPLLLRLYFLHGGSRRWIPAWLQSAGFPMLIFPVMFLYSRSPPGTKFLASPKFLLSGVAIGVLTGLDNFMYSYGLSFLPVSTSSLLLSTQLVFTAFFALIIVRHKFTPYSINAVVLMTLGSVLLGISKNGDRPAGVTSAQYLLGFLITIGAACLLGFMLPCTEIAYTKAGKSMTYSSVLQFQLAASFSSTVFCTIGMLINKDFSAIVSEANAYELGPAKYYLVLGASVVLWQLLFIGNMGLIFCASSLSAGVFAATMLPVTEIAAVIVYREKFSGAKGMSLALCIWGFASYFYGSHRANKKQVKDNEIEEHN